MLSLPFKKILPVLQQHSSIIWVILLYLGGIILWGDFFSWGRFPIDFHDWAEVNAPRLALVKDAVEKGVLPLHINVTWPLRGITDRFLSIPDTLISPQVLLLLFLDVPGFVFANHLLLYTVGFLGLLWLQRRIHLSRLSFCLLYILFNFNGHIVSHMTIGHTSWGGYYLYPWFAGSVFTFIEKKPDWKLTGGLGLVLAFSLLQGSFHQFTWMLIFLGFLCLAAWKKIISLATGVLAGAALGLYRILPPVLLLGQFDDEYKGGYSNPIWIIRSLVTDVRPANAMNHIFPTTSLGWWEFDTFIGYAGAILVAGGMVLWLLRACRERLFPVLLVPITGLALLSIGKIYSWFRLIPFPLLSGERVASRMFSLALFFAVVVAVLEVDRWLRKRKSRIIWTAGYLLAMSVTSLELIRHMTGWAVARAFPFFPYTPVDLSLIQVANRPDPIYTGIILAGALFSIISAIGLAWLAFKRKNLPEK